MTLQSALEIVRSELMCDEPPAAAIALAAEETGLKPALIERKATESFGDLATFGERERLRVWRAEKRMAEVERELAAEAAAAEAAKNARAVRRVSGDSWARDMRALLRLISRASRD